ncbi:MAG: hypothetical protein QF535_17230, partial [Anaerolineales bacterium]|nr:hypothetical protein [Anaerolineales bacterium]
MTDKRTGAVTREAEFLSAATILGQDAYYAHGVVDVDEFVPSFDANWETDLSGTERELSFYFNIVRDLSNGTVTHKFYNTMADADGNVAGAFINDASLSELFCVKNLINRIAREGRRFKRDAGSSGVGDLPLATDGSYILNNGVDDVPLDPTYPDASGNLQQYQSVGFYAAEEYSDWIEDRVGQGARPANAHDNIYVYRTSGTSNNALQSTNPDLSFAA